MDGARRELLAHSCGSWGSEHWGVLALCEFRQIMKSDCHSKDVPTHMFPNPCVSVPNFGQIGSIDCRE